MNVFSRIRTTATDLFDTGRTRMRDAMDRYGIGAESDRTEERTDKESGGSGGGTASDPHRADSVSEKEAWTEAQSPTSKALHGVVQTANGPYAVGNDGNVLTRNEGNWEFAIEAGPATKRNALTTVDATADGKRIWFAGSSGSLGCYDLRTGEKYDYSAPEGKTSTWEAIAVAGPAGDETLRIANGSGEVLPVTTDDDGCPQWGGVTKPGGGSTITALDYGDACYAVDTSGNVFTEAGDGWERIGIRNAQVNFFDVSATEDTVLVAGGGGLVYRYDRRCENWTPIQAGTGALHSVAHTREATVAASASGHIFERRADDGWVQIASPVENDLLSIALGKRSVAVGAGGTIVEQKP